jgi:L-lactate dehydrogenase complex protein LldF
MKWWGGRDGMIHKLPLASGWTDGRDLPAPVGRTFRELFRAQEQAKHR